MLTAWSKVEECLTVGLNSMWIEIFIREKKKQCVDLNVCRSSWEGRGEGFQHLLRHRRRWPRSFTFRRFIDGDTRSDEDVTPSYCQLLPLRALMKLQGRSFRWSSVRTLGRICHECLFFFFLFHIDIDLKTTIFIYWCLHPSWFSNPAF